jgi:hypothetical protein
MNKAEDDEIKELVAFRYLGSILINLGKCKEEVLN